VAAARQKRGAVKRKVVIDGAWTSKLKFFSLSNEAMLVHCGLAEPAEAFRDLGAGAVKGNPNSDALGRNRGEHRRVIVLGVGKYVLLLTRYKRVIIRSRLGWIPWCSALISIHVCSLLGLKISCYPSSECNSMSW